MEAFGIYLLKSAVWLTGFAIVFLTVLRNERYFRLNRIYLLSGIVASIIFPFYTWHYAVLIPSSTGNITISGLSAKLISTSAVDFPFYWWLYVTGMGWLAFRLIWQTVRVIRKLQHAGYEVNGPVKLVRTSEYAASFSFFSYVFVNPSTSDVETKEIVNHESEHIKQRHWFDLLLVEILCMLQWFNPFVWIYARQIRQNHEYLADEKALQNTSDPAIYQATLLNQLLGAPVISLANSFSYSLNKKRFKMMKKTIDSPFRKLKLLFALPLIVFVFYAFAKPEYVSAFKADQTASSILKENDKTVKGTVVNADSKPLSGTSVILMGSTMGAVTDKNGSFKLKGVPEDGKLVFSFVGQKSVILSPEFDKNMVVKMEPATILLDKVTFHDATEKPVKFNSMNSDNPPLIFLDGLMIDKARMDAINPNDIQSISVIKDKSATAVYGEKAKYGVILIVLKKNSSGLKDANRNANITYVDHFDPLHPPLYVMDGRITEKTLVEKVLADGVESVTILKDKNATDKYGDKGKYGVIEMTTKEKEGATITLATFKKEGNPDYFAKERSGAAVDKEFAASMKKTISKDAPQKKEVFTVVEEMPQFPGGTEAMMKFIGGNVKYPDQAKKDNVQGKVFVSFVIKSSGKVGDVKIARSVDPLLDAEAARVIGSMPDWKPGKQHGEAVDVAYTIPIQFALDGEQTKTEGKNTFKEVEEMPQYIGGPEAMMTFIGVNVKYPEQAKTDKVQGKVFVSFVVSSNGKVENVKIARGVDSMLDAEAMRVISLMPDWKPGKQGGKAVKVAFTVPIQFRLQ
ncbi:MAG: TonB family protein [Mariniphaga sp.]